MRLALDRFGVSCVAFELDLLRGLLDGLFGCRRGRLLVIRLAAGLRSACGGRLGLYGLARDGQLDLRAPAGGLDHDGAARVVGLPLDALLRLDVRDADLTELAEVAGKRLGVADLRPELRRGLDERALHLRGDHAPPFARSRASPSAVRARIGVQRPFAGVCGEKYDLGGLRAQCVRSNLLKVGKSRACARRCSAKGLC